MKSTENPFMVIVAKRRSRIADPSLIAMIIKTQLKFNKTHKILIISNKFQY